MRRREVLERLGTASTISLAAFAGATSASELPSDGDHVVRELDGESVVITELDGEAVVVPVDDLGTDDVTTEAFCPHYCCDDCVDYEICLEECGGCSC